MAQTLLTMATVGMRRRQWHHPLCTQSSLHGHITAGVYVRVCRLRLEYGQHKNQELHHMNKCTMSLYSKLLEQKTSFADLNTQFTCFDSVCGLLTTCLSTIFFVRITVPGKTLRLNFLPDKFTIYYTDFCIQDYIHCPL